MSNDELKERFKRAETLYRRSLGERNITWHKTHCPHCQNKVEYSPKPGFDGALRCGNCGKTFKVARLTDYTQ